MPRWSLWRHLSATHPLPYLTSSAMHPACKLTQCVAMRQILIGATAKRMLVGTLAPGAVWRKHDALNFARMLAFVNEIPMSHTFVEAIRGSPWINMLGRLRGTRIGRDAFIDTLAVNDYDLPHIGDRAVIARNATIFCHLGADGMLSLVTRGWRIRPHLLF